jgi:hypothetical protein
MVVVKLIAHCWPLSKLTSLKLVRNNLEDRAEEYLVDTIANPNFKVNKLFFEWNTLINPDRYLKL